MAVGPRVGSAVVAGWTLSEVLVCGTTLNGWNASDNLFIAVVGLQPLWLGWSLVPAVVFFVVAGRPWGRRTVPLALHVLVAVALACLLGCALDGAFGPSTLAEVLTHSELRWLWAAIAIAGLSMTARLALSAGPLRRAAQAGVLLVRDSASARTATAQRLRGWALLTIVAGGVVLSAWAAGQLTAGGGTSAVAGLPGPDPVALSPDGRTLYVADYGDHIIFYPGGGVESGRVGTTVTPVSVGTGRVGTPIQVGRLPSQLVMAGGTLYVLLADGGTVVPVNVATQTVGQPMSFNGGATAMTASADGRTLYVADAGAGDAEGPADFADPPAVVAVDLATGRRSAPMALPVTASALVLSGGTLDVACGNSDGGILAAVNITTGTVTRSVELPLSPTGLAVSPGGRFAYIPGGLGIGMDNGVYGFAIVDLATWQVTRDEENLDSPPPAIAVAPDGRTVYLQVGTDTVLAINARTGATKTIALPASIVSLASWFNFPIGPGSSVQDLPNGYGLVISPDGRTLYASGSGGVMSIALPPS